MTHVLSLLAFVAGLAALVFGADRLVAGASRIAAILGISPLVIGMVIVGIGTSTPEILVSATAAFKGNSGIAIGNVVGSNVTNVGLVLGLAAALSPVMVAREVVRREVPLMLFVATLATVLLLDDALTRLDGLILLAVFALVFGSTLIEARRSRVVIEAPTPGLSAAAAGGVTAAGLLALLVGSQAMVWGAARIARELGIDELVIGLTVVAIGTSLPELAATVAAARRKEHAVAVGNVLGSNTFNILLVLPFPALLAPGAVAEELVARDCTTMLGFALAMWAFTRWFDPDGHQVNRVEGAVLLCAYFAYVVVLVIEGVGVGV